VAPVIVQPTGQFHGDIVVSFLGVPEHVLDDAAPFDSRDDVFNDHANPRYEAVALLVFVRQLAVARLLLRLVDGDTRHLMPLVGRVPIQVNAVGEHRPLLVADLLVVLLALVGRAQILDQPVFQATDHAVLQRVAFFLPL
jgi:hypothetical protein